MYHDFNDTTRILKPDPTDPSKQCTGYMDYFSKTHGWSKCSVSDMTRYLANNCLEPLDGGIRYIRTDNLGNYSL